MVDSLNTIITTYEIHGGGTEADSRIASAAAQNADAQAQPVSSMQWARIALDTVGYGTEKIGKFTPAEGQAVLSSLGSLLAKYNERPDVAATADNLDKPAAKRLWGSARVGWIKW